MMRQYGNHVVAGVINNSIIHPMAVIEKGAHIGQGCKIGPFCYIGKDCRIGSETIVHPGAQVIGNTVIGSNCEIYANSVVGGKSQDKKSDVYEISGRVLIGNNTVIRENCTINCSSPKGLNPTYIGDRVLILAGAHVGHDSHVEDNVVLSNNVLIAGHVRIGSRSILGGGSAVRQFVDIGPMSMIGGLSAVDRHVLPYSLVQGNRAKLRGVNIVGLRRAKFSIPQIRVLQHTFALLQGRTRTLETVCDDILSTETDALMHEISKFVLGIDRNWGWQQKKLGIILEACQ